MNLTTKGKLFLYEQLSELEPAYAMTVHKSQGSEYDTVILAAGNAAQSLLVRNVLYTAVTRAKKAPYNSGRRHCRSENGGK